VFAFLPTVLSLGGHLKPGCLLATTALRGAMAPGRPLATTIDRAWALIAFHSVAFVVAVFAWFAAMESRLADGKFALLDSVSARCGALRELAP